MSLSITDRFPRCIHRTDQDMHYIYAGIKAADPCIGSGKTFSEALDAASHYAAHVEIEEEEEAETERPRPSRLFSF